jgi:uncharacterized protein
MWRLGLISDTHNYFDPLLPRCFEGVDRILHAGDIGSLDILARLEEIALVTAVAGNCDVDLALPFSQWIDLAPGGVYLRHVVDPQAPSEEWLRSSQSSRPRVVVFGHTHRPYYRDHDGIIFANPGYAGKARFHLPRSVAVLFLDGLKTRIEFHPLP